MERQEQIYKALFDLGIGCSRDDDDDPIYDGQDLQSAFYRGAKWADENPKQGLVNLSQVWHPAEEEPGEDMDILCIIKNGNVHKVSKIDHQLYDWLKGNHNIQKWAYINDLLPKGGEK